MLIKIIFKERCEDKYTNIITKASSIAITGEEVIIEYGDESVDSYDRSYDGFIRIEEIKDIGD